MIFTFVHTHVWEPRPEYHHGERVFRCTICGDKGFQTDRDKKEKDIK